MYMLSCGSSSKAKSEMPRRTEFSIAEISVALLFLGGVEGAISATDGRFGTRIILNRIIMVGLGCVACSLCASQMSRRPVQPKLGVMVLAVLICLPLQGRGFRLGSEGTTTTTFLQFSSRYGSFIASPFAPSRKAKNVHRWSLYK